MKFLQIILFIFLASFGVAQDDFTIENYHVDMTLKEDGDIDVIETIDLIFHEKRRGIFRTFPRKGAFKNHIQSIKVSNVSVEGFKFKKYNKGNDVIIRIGDKNTYISGPQKYVIKYTASNGILNFEEHEELFWTLIGVEWQTDIKNATFDINFQKSITLNTDDVKLFSGTEGSSINYGQFEINSQRITGSNHSVLGKGKGMTIGVRLPKGYVYKNSAQISDKVPPPKVYPKDYWWPLPIIMILGGLFGFFKWGRSTDKEDYHFNESQSFYPPADMSPAEVGTFYDYKVHGRDIISLIPYWGHMGLLQVRMMEMGRNQEMYIELLGNLDADAPEYEKVFFNELFRKSNLVKVDSLKHEFYGTFSKVSGMLKRGLDESNYDAESRQLFHSGWSLAGAFFCIALGVVSMMVLHWFFTGAGMLALGLIMFVLYFLEPKKSERGMRLHAQLEHFKKSISNPDQEGLNDTIESDPSYLEKVFPYVVAFGIDKEWMSRFKDVFKKAPSWYHNSTIPYMVFGDFHRDFKIKDVEKTISTPPIAEKGSSSFGGGGSVGGGFGGGGGGSW